MNNKDVVPPKRTSIWEIEERYRYVYVLTFLVVLAFLLYYFSNAEIAELPSVLVRIGSKVAPYTLLAAAIGFILAEVVAFNMVLSSGLSRYLERKHRAKQIALEREQLEIEERKKLLSDNQVEAVVEIIKESTAETHERLDKVDKKLEEHTERMDKQDSKIEQVEEKLSKLTKEQGDGR